MREEACIYSAHNIRSSRVLSSVFHDMPVPAHSLGKARLAGVASNLVLKHSILTLCDILTTSPSMHRMTFPFCSMA